MKALGVIPARFAATRFPGKPIAKISGREMITWVIEGAQTSKLLSEVIVATDDARIAEVARKSNVEVVMTDSALPSGTDRIYAAVKARSGVDVVVNVQGDEPLIQGAVIDELIQPFQKDSQLQMATLGHAISAEELQSANSVKIVLNQNRDALYFSRFPIPYSREKLETAVSPGCLKHIGLYAYRLDFLARFCATPQCELERAEGLEQLRALHLGARIRVIETESRSWGVDSPDDLARIEEILSQRGARSSG